MSLTLNSSPDFPAVRLRKNIQTAFPLHFPVNNRYFPVVIVGIY